MERRGQGLRQAYRGRSAAKALLGAIAAATRGSRRLRLRASPFLRKLICRRLASAKRRAEPEGASYLTQIGVICVRSMKDRRFESFSADSLGVALRCHPVRDHVVAAGKGREYRYVGANNVAALLFFLSMFLSVNLMFSSIFTFPTEKTMLLKERRPGVSGVCVLLRRDAGRHPDRPRHPVLGHHNHHLMAGLKPTVGAYLLTLITLVISCFTAGSWDCSSAAVLTSRELIGLHASCSP